MHHIKKNRLKLVNYISVRIPPGVFSAQNSVSNRQTVRRLRSHKTPMTPTHRVNVARRRQPYCRYPTSFPGGLGRTILCHGGQIRPDSLLHRSIEMLTATTIVKYIESHSFQARIRNTGLQVRCWTLYCIYPHAGKRLSQTPHQYIATLTWDHRLPTAMPQMAQA